MGHTKKHKLNCLSCKFVFLSEFWAIKRWTYTTRITWEVLSRVWFTATTLEKVTQIILGLSHHLMRRPIEVNNLKFKFLVFEFLKCLGNFSFFLLSSC